MIIPGDLYVTKDMKGIYFWSVNNVLLIKLKVSQLIWFVKFAFVTIHVNVQFNNYIMIVYRLYSCY